jgi:hypothetical protein
MVANLETISALDDLLDGLTASQLRNLLDWLWVNRYSVTRANIKHWCKIQPV